MRRSKFDALAKREGKPLKDVMRELYEQHGSQTKVAAAIGISQSRVSQVLKDLGLTEKTILIEREELAS